VHVIGLHPFVVEEYIDEAMRVYELSSVPKKLAFAGRAVCIHPRVGPLDLHLQ